MDHYPSVSRELAIRVLGLAAVILTADRVLVPRKARQQKERPSGSADSVINIDPEIMGATPVFMDTRVPVSILIDYLVGGYGLNYFLYQYPTVSRELAVRFLELWPQKS